MALSPELVEAIRGAIGRYIGMANKDSETFWNTALNCQALYDYLRREGIPETEWIHENIFASAAFQCEAQGLLAKRPVTPKLTPEQQQALQNLRDSADGDARSRGHQNVKSRSEELADERARIRKYDEEQMAVASEMKKAADLRRDMDERPWNYLPDYKSNVSRSVLAGLPPSVLKLFCQKQAEYLRSGGLLKDSEVTQ